MSRLFLLATMCYALVACVGGVEWSKPGMTAATRDADIAGCGSKASHLQKDDPEVVKVIDQCMASRGYQKKKDR